MPMELKTPLSLSDCFCSICTEIFLEPVTLPCQHTLCNPCFQLTVEKASLCCPFCRRRVSSWARYNARNNTLINLELWEAIQKNFPEECKHRINGQDQENVCIPQPIRCLSKPGELRQEYEAEITKVEEERQAHEQEESKASEEYIQKLLEKEEEEQKRLAEEKKKQMAEQLLLDERLARKLSLNLNTSSEGHILSTPSPGPSPLNACRTSKSKSACSGDIKKYLSPKSCSPSPPVIPFSKLEEESSGGFSEERTLIPVTPGNQQNSSSANCSLVVVNNPVGNINPSESLKEISLAKRKYQESSLELAINSDLKDKKRRTFSQTGEDEEEEMNEIQQQLSLEQKFYERFKQEQEDRLLALKLQREVDKEQKTMNRKKGSPDQYHLRPKTSSVSCKLFQNSQPPNKKAEANNHKHRRSSRNENSKHSNIRQPKSPGINGGNVLSCVLNSSDSKEAELLPNKQKTILQMFKMSAAK